MKITYDRAADAAYIQFADEIGAGAVDRTCGCDPRALGGIVNLDLDAHVRILGIEVLTASALLPAELINSLAD